jgi:hypothetical protein
MSPAVRKRRDGSVQNFHPAAARGDDVEHDHMLGIRHDIAGDDGCRRCFGDPGRALLDVEEDRTGEPDGPQYVR